MKVFLDTSSLIKKYVSESGSGQLEKQLERVSEITVAPIYWIELNSALERRLQEKTMSHQDAAVIRQEAAKDLRYFGKTIWNESLEQKAVEMIKKYSLKTLDSVQLASGILAKADFFLTSDKNLYKAACEEVDARFI